MSEFALANSQVNKSIGRVICIVLFAVLCIAMYCGTVLHCVPLSSGLFESDKLLFSFAMTTKIQEVEGQLNHEELDFFIKVHVEHDIWDSFQRFQCVHR